MSSMAATAAGRLSVAVSSLVVSKAAPAEGESRVAVLLVDMERVTTSRSTARCRDRHPGNPCVPGPRASAAGVRKAVDELKIPGLHGVDAVTWGLPRSGFQLRRDRR